MFEEDLTRRKFLNFGKLSLLFLLNSCSNSSNNIRISLQSSFYPKSLKDTFPKNWEQKDINFGKKILKKSNFNFPNSDFTIINDGWINSINFENFQNLSDVFPENKFDNRSIDFLNSFLKSQSRKLCPIGVVPYAVIIKNNKDLIYEASKSWDFLISDKLKGKIIFPQSPRIFMSISKKINKKNSFKKLKDQIMLFDDQNSLNWLINSQASVAIVPYSLCMKFLRFDSRLSIVFPSTGVPLIWTFLLSKSNRNNEILINWIKSLESKTIVDKLANQGWYLPFQNEYTQSKFNKIEKGRLGPSKICWENSWSFPPLNEKEKFNFENIWNKYLTP